MKWVARLVVVGGFVVAIAQIVSFFSGRGWIYLALAIISVLFVMANLDDTRWVG